MNFIFLSLGIVRQYYKKETIDNLKYIRLIILQIILQKIYLCVNIQDNYKKTSYELCMILLVVNYDYLSGNSKGLNLKDLLFESI